MDRSGLPGLALAAAGLCECGPATAAAPGRRRVNHAQATRIAQVNFNSLSDDVSSQVTQA
jgi:hypothetical protein